MNDKELIARGVLDIDEYGCLTCAGRYLIELIQETFSVGDYVAVSYYITDLEVTQEQAMEMLILKTIGGDISRLEFVLDAYSEYTIMDLQEHLVVGGHDLFNELSGHRDKFLNLKIRSGKSIIVTDILKNL